MSLKRSLTILFFSSIAALLDTHMSFAAPTVATESPKVVALPDFTAIVESTGAGVVDIHTTAQSNSNSSQDGMDEDMREFFRRFFGVPIPRQQPPIPRNNRKPGHAPPQNIVKGLGSGFIISQDGYILTNAHVVDGANDIQVTLRDQREFKAKLIGLDIKTDVALLKIEGSQLPSLTMGDSDLIRVGEWALAIGSPFGLDNTVTKGIISAKARDTGDYSPLIQTDVAVNPGNSGGPLLNLRGQVIGINSQIYSRSGGFMGISFAIPINDALHVAEQLKTYGRVIRGYIGVTISEVTKDLAESLGRGNNTKGALVQQVQQGGPAAVERGLQAGDIILEFDQVPIERFSDLRRMAGNAKPGSKIKLAVWRNGERHPIELTVAELESGKKTKSDEQRDKPVFNALGLIVSDLSAAQKTKLQIENGVLVEAAGGPAANAGLQEGDILLRLNYSTGRDAKQFDIKDARQFNALVAKLDPQKPVTLFVRRDREDRQLFFTLKPSMRPS